MNDLHSVLRFILQEGALLAVLFVAVGFVVALFQQGIGNRLSASLGRASLETGAVFAATAGAVTPFCSCSTVPVLSGMLRSGVRLGVCFTFLIASPVINEGVLLVLLREQSMAMAAIFLLVAGAVSVLLGVLVDRLGMARFVRTSATGQELEDAVRIAPEAGNAQPPWRVRIRFALFAALSEFRSSAPYLAVGMLVGGLIYGYVPHEWIAQLQGELPGVLLILAMAVLGLPVYVNATMVIPIALALLAKGVGMGAVAAFLVSAAGTSIPEMILLARLFKAPLIVAHVVSILVAATVVGIGLDWAVRLFPL